MNKESALRAYRTMRLIREFETQIAREFAAGTVPGMTHLYIGQEAVAVGVCHELGNDDFIASTHRGHGHCIAKGCDVGLMALELFRKEGGICKGKGGSMHIADVSKGMLGANAIVGGASPLAGGAALAIKLRGQANVAVAFAGDGAANQGTTLEEMNFAASLKLPLIFAIESNGYGEHTLADYAAPGDLTERAAAFGMAAEKVDGTDFFAVHAAMERAVKRAHSGKGPSSIECVATRWHGHFEGDPQLYRPKGEVDALRRNSDPLKKFRATATKKKLGTKKEFDAIDADVENEVTKAVEAALAAPQPDLSELLTDVYATY
ncbi:MAG: thiamine pyrophosphate-dependent dehydrogenase E1 component subunit alpha [Pseudomonadota bacterium]